MLFKGLRKYPHTFLFDIQGYAEIIAHLFFDIQGYAEISAHLFF
jgi:hypothetical protein